MSCQITVAQFQAYFDRGQFTYGTDLPAIRDTDIERAIAEALAAINFELFPTEDVCQQAQYYATAHYLFLDVDAGNSGGQPTFVQSSRSAGGLSESLSIPTWMNQGEFAFYATTYWGQKFLVLAKPYLDGAVFAVPGATQP